MATARALLAALAAVLLFSGCGSAGTGPAGGVVATEVEVSGGQVHAPSQRVEARVGQRVRLTVRGDAADELHVHGYDKAARLAPGAPATIEFTADIPGVFEIELHESGLALPSLEVR
ncbi:hypothetical protein HUO13_05740 [Saccharopolyspora erythraea]|uniref:hypothetical protein n=1 Tax=Saccharopolyspora erythraea TaxID=1836 RepID=UPI001BA54304|nr:hypothetical protein [Saccharopolyspora erythraea]QUH00384.1 hypothetical protein HUO13_05740 [Saccharopolyspora erythraea]